MSIKTVLSYLWRKDSKCVNEENIGEPKCIDVMLGDVTEDGILQLREEKARRKSELSGHKYRLWCLVNCKDRRLDETDPAEVSNLVDRIISVQETLMNMIAALAKEYGGIDDKERRSTVCNEMENAEDEFSQILSTLRSMNVLVYLKSARTVTMLSLAM